jgi:hypothetical protein
MANRVQIKISFIVISLFMAITIAYFKFDMFRLMGFQSSDTSKSTNDKLKSQSSESNKIGESDAPAYFSVFKFVNNFVPAKQEN